VNLLQLLSKACGAWAVQRMLVMVALLAPALPMVAQTSPWQNAVWIAAGSINDPSPSTPQSQPMPLFRRSFDLPAQPTSATLRICGLGQYEAHINGKNVTAAVLTPAWTLYTRHIAFDSYDVTSLLNAGKNALGVMLGNGLYNVLPDPGRYNKFEHSFGQPKLIAELTVHFAAYPDVILTSNTGWTTAPGPITFSHAYGGEDFDARLEPAGWDTAQFDDSGWSKANAVNGPGGVLIPDSAPPVKAFTTFPPVHVTHPRPGLTVYDLGQNFAGWPEIAVTGPRGAAVKLLCGELLTPSGEVTQESAHAYPANPNLFTYTLRGGATEAEPETWRPRFSYYGFRFVQVETSSPDVVVVRLAGDFLHDDVRQTGAFTSSDPLFNRIHGLIDSAMLSNMVSVMTDCPHREKLGWLEETHLVGAALQFNWDLESLYAKISGDMADSQQPDGMVPSTAPELIVFQPPFRDTPEWGSAVILSPWIAYQFSGDAGPLRAHYHSMRRYAAYLASKTEGNVLTYGLGDWYDIGPGEPGGSKLTSAGLTATAIYYQDLTTLARIAVLTGHTDDAPGYNHLAEAVKTAFNRRFFDPATNLYDRGSQTAQAMPLALGLVPAGHQQAVLANLVAAIRATQNHVTSGEVGFHSLVRALTDFNRSDVLFDMFSRTDAPSYGALVAAGVTSLPEAWDANPRSSQNHFMLGNAEEWFYRGLAGIDFNRGRGKADAIRIAPAVVGSLTSASATLQSSLGLIASAWHRDAPDANTLTMDVTIPMHATAVVTFPAGYQEDAGDHRVRMSSDRVRLRAGAYHFRLRRVRAR
jgi:hypothetical protein